MSAFAGQRGQVPDFDLAGVGICLQGLGRQLARFVAQQARHNHPVLIDQHFEIVVEARVARVRPAHLFVITLDHAVRIEVVLDHGKPGLPRGLDGGDGQLHVFVAAVTAIEDGARDADHRVVRDQAVVPGGLNGAANVLFPPWEAANAHAYHVRHAELADALISSRAAGGASSGQGCGGLCGFRPGGQGSAEAASAVYRPRRTSARSRRTACSTAAGRSLILRLQIGGQRCAAITQAQTDLRSFRAFLNRPLARRGRGVRQLDRLRDGCSSRALQHPSSGNAEFQCRTSVYQY